MKRTQMKTRRTNKTESMQRLKIIDFSPFSEAQLPNSEIEAFSAVVYWQALRSLNIDSPVSGFGQLLREH